MKVVLTIAGTDPSGAAGIQADLQVIREHGHYGVSVVTAVLAQNTAGVREVFAMTAAAVAAQLDAVFDDFDVAAVKVGLVPDDELVELLVERLRRYRVVWDPVISSGDGGTQLFAGSAPVLRSATAAVDIVTPNIAELELLASRAIRSRADAHEAAAQLASGASSVLAKVGHLSHGDTIADIFATLGESCDLAALPAVDVDVRGTGCHLSTAVACGLASGKDHLAAIEDARRYLNGLLVSRTASPGRGRPVVAH